MKAEACFDWTDHLPTQTFPVLHTLQEHSYRWAYGVALGSLLAEMKSIFKYNLLKIIFFEKNIL